MCRCDSGSCGESRYELGSVTYGARLRAETIVAEQADPKVEGIESSD